MCEVAPSMCEVAPSTYEVAPSTCEVAPSTCEVAPSTCKVAPSTLKLLEVQKSAISPLNNSHLYSKNYIVLRYIPISSY
jgi:hypothetical protein